ncbi:MAG: hypothetical protein Q8P67_22345 [archaeon]|nr:hypothetical protein [archaeon]
MDLLPGYLQSHEPRTFLFLFSTSFSSSFSTSFSSSSSSSSSSLS